MSDSDIKVDDRARAERPRATPGGTPGARAARAARDALIRAAKRERAAGARESARRLEETADAWHAEMLREGGYVD